RGEDLGNPAAALPWRNADIPESGGPFRPRLGQWSVIAVHDPARGDHGSCYVSTTGHVMVQDDTIVEFDRMDTLWWFDGTDTWFQTGLRNDANGAEAPAFAVVRSEEHTSELQSRENLVCRLLLEKKKQNSVK